MRAGFKSLLLIPAMVLASSGMAGDWFRFRGPDANGISSETGINKDWKAKPPKELWRIALSDKGYGGPTVADGKLFIIDHAGGAAGKDIVRAIDISNGKEVWNFPYDCAFNPGQEDWGYGRSSPVFDNGKVYSQSPLGHVHCLDAKTGQKIWACNLLKDFQGQHGKWHYAASPAIDGEKVILCPGGKAAPVVALDKNTGKELWRGGNPEAAGYATPAIATIGGKKQYLIFAGANIFSVDADKGGAALWKFAWPTKYEVNAAMPLPMSNDRVFITSGYGTGCALLAIANNTPAASWTNKEIKAHFSSSVFIDGFIYGTSDPGELVCIDPATGLAKWKQRGFEKGGIIAVDGVLIGLDGADGNLIMCKIDSKAYTELGRIRPLGGRSWTTPILADGKLYVRNREALVCLDAK